MNRFTATRVQIPISALGFSACVRKACKELFMGGIDDLPNGWRVVVMARGCLFDAGNLIGAERDGVLCPRHFKEIDGLLVGSGFGA